MIKINLLGEKKDNTPIYVLQGIAFCAAVILAVAVCFVHNGGLSAELELTKSRQMLLERQLNKLRIKTRKVDEMEKKRKLLTEKLTTIARLKAKKQGPVRVLDDVTSAIPPRSWLKRVNQKGDLVEFTGIALDNQTVSRFMVTLEETPHFKNVDLMYTRKFIRDGVSLQQFALSAKLADPLKRQLAKMAKEKAEEGAGIEKDVAGVAETPAEQESGDE